MALQAFRSYTYAANYFQGSWVVAAPPSMQVDDLMIAFCTGNSQARGIDTVYGWTLLFDSIYLPAQYGGRTQMFIKVANINDIGGVTYSWPTDHYSFAGGIFAIANAVAATSSYSFINAQTNNDAIIHAAPITPRGPNQMLFWIAGGITAGCDARTPLNIPMYFNSYNGGGGHDVFCLSGGTASYPGGTTGAPWADGAIYYVHTNAHVALFTFQSYFAPHELANPLMTEV